MKKIGIIGLGKRGECLLDILKTSCAKEAKAVALVDDSKSVFLQEGMTRYSTVDEMIRKGKVEGVIVATRCDSHTDYAVELSRYSIPVLLEKPVSINQQQANFLEKKAMSKNDLFCVSFPLVATPLFTKVNELTRKIKSIYHIQAQNYVSYGEVYFESWYQNPKITGGLLLQKATHDLNYLMKMAESPIENILTQSIAGRHFKIPRGISKNEANEDFSSTLIQFKNGIQAVYTQIFTVKNQAGKRGARITGSTATVEFDWVQQCYQSYSHHENHSQCNHFPVEGNHWGGDLVLLKNFLAVIEGRERPLSGLKEGLNSVNACLAAKESIKTQQWTKVKSL